MARTIEEAVRARDVVTGAVRSAGAAARRRSDSPESALRALPSVGALRQAFEALAGSELTEPEISRLRRGALYAVIAAGFASELLWPRLREVRNDTAEPVGEEIYRWMTGQLDTYKLSLESISKIEPLRAVEWVVRSIRLHFALSGTILCDPENLNLTACRRRLPYDSDYVSTITTTGDFPRTLPHLALVFDPRQWPLNPFAKDAFIDVTPVADKDGNGPYTRPEPRGTTWLNGPVWITEKVTDGAVTLTNTLSIEFVVTSTWIRFTYSLGRTIATSSSLKLEVNQGYLSVDPIPARPGWCRVRMEKDVRFNETTGSDGGTTGWGDLPNAIAPELMRKWLEGICYMPCWTPP